MSPRYGGRPWERLYRELEFTTLPELRRQAEGWRNGLGGLTALVGLLAVLKGRDDLAKLPEALQWATLGMTGGAFLLLVLGSVLAIQAAHGTPDTSGVAGGTDLHRWTEKETRTARGRLRGAARCCLAGVLLVFAAVVVGWVGSESPDTHLVRVSTDTGERCGEFLGAGARGLRLETGEGDEKKEVVLALSHVREVVPVQQC
ncbi:hypothetical protein [Streptomyces sp. NPDC007088]|uniref:hypothetical protein n=1 Tax=Streptomyces sp. NPDC007088 TaxID=3364773 RepID=UPI0036BAB3D3